MDACGDSGFKKMPPEGAGLSARCRDGIPMLSCYGRARIKRVKEISIMEDNMNTFRSHFHPVLSGGLRPWR